MMQCVQRDHAALLPLGQWQCDKDALKVLLSLANDYAKLLMTRAVEFAQGGGTVDGAKEKNQKKRKRARVTPSDLEFAFEAIQMENTTF